jgi:hypothetical protein
LKGTCLCGGVGYQIEPPFRLFQYCHCSTCRKVTGSLHSANLVVPASQFKWLKGPELVGKWDFPEAKYLTTAFCRKCGSSLPWEAKGGKNIIVPAGTLDEDPAIKPQQNIFWGSRASWCVETSELPKHTELPERK